MDTPALQHLLYRVEAVSPRCHVYCTEGGLMHDNKEGKRPSNSPLVSVSCRSGGRRSNRRLFGIWHIRIILGEELDETGGDGGGIPARQVVARTRYRHRVDFWNPLLQ